ncbi:hypothetical protein DPMN_089228 [Dreissena polymorpha]|uniref:Uncharacterized protein n=1 Tax=Dreissena polymorpha TaxID=45954 RepID=A0A9D4KW04_DREPO|nr:hypothetical protein DPMN_089228 [Dreissena polymorpha]
MQTPGPYCWVAAQATGSTQATESMQIPELRCCMSVQATVSAWANKWKQGPGSDWCVAVQATGSTQPTELIQGPGPERSVIAEIRATVSSCVIEGTQVMASAQVAGSIAEPGSMVDECEWAMRWSRTCGSRVDFV